MLTRLSYSQSFNFNLNIKSEFAAESAVQLAITNLTNWAKNNTHQKLYEAWEFYGEDLNMNTKLDDFEDVNGNKILDKYSLPLEQTLHPSYTEVSSKGISNLVVVDKKPRLVSKIIELGNDYIVTNSIKVIDASGQLNLNSGNKNISLLLSNLLEYLNINLDANHLLANAPFLSYDHLKKLLGKNTFDVLRNYITIYGKRKKSNSYILPGFGLKKGPINYLDNLIPEIGVVEEKVLFNVNSIDTSLFFANVYKIQGFALILDDISYTEFPIKKSDKSQFNLYPVLFTPFKLTPVIGRLVDVKIDKPTAEKLSEFFDERRFNLKMESFERVFKDKKWAPSSLFANQSDFVEFLEEAQKNNLISHAQKKLILANVRDYITYDVLYTKDKEKTYVDKYMVTQSSGEFIFYPDGLFEIETMGTVIGRNGNLLSKSFRETVVNIYDVEYVNTKNYLKNFRMENFCILDNSDPLIFTLCPNNSVLPGKSDFYVDFTKKGFNAKAKGNVRKPLLNNATKIVKEPILLPQGAYFDSFSSLEYDSSDILPFVDAGNDCKKQQDKEDSRVGVCKYLKGSIYLWYKPYYPLKDFSGFQNIFSISLFKKEYFDKFKLSDAHLFSFLTVPQNILSIYNKDAQNPVVFMEIPALGGEEFIAGVDSNIDVLPSLWHLYVIKFDTSSDKVKDYIKLYLNGRNVSRELFYNYDMGVVNKGLMVDYAKDNKIVFGYDENLKRLWNFHLHGILGEFGITNVNLSEWQIKGMFTKGRYVTDNTNISISLNNNRHYVKFFWEEHYNPDFMVPEFNANVSDNNNVLYKFQKPDIYNIDSKNKKLIIQIRSSGYEHLKYTESFIYKIGLIYLNFYKIK